MTNELLLFQNKLLAELLRKRRETEGKMERNNSYVTKARLDLLDELTEFFIKEMEKTQEQAA